ncbi:MAG: hypothetical protein GYA24_14065, partial [Candidatus Lokiarchaeota archaeon]|nr:hypothetical protein [Candidatus Lokiarchaeota archaeon]
MMMNRWLPRRPPGDLISVFGNELGNAQVCQHYKGERFMFSVFDLYMNQQRCIGSVDESTSSIPSRPRVMLVASTQRSRRKEGMVLFLQLQWLGIRLEHRTDELRVELGVALLVRDDADEIVVLVCLGGEHDLL